MKQSQQRFKIKWKDIFGATTTSYAYGSCAKEAEGEVRLCYLIELKEVLSVEPYNKEL